MPGSENGSVKGSTSVGGLDNRHDEGSCGSSGTNMVDKGCSPPNNYRYFNDRQNTGETPRLSDIDSICCSALYDDELDADCYQDCRCGPCSDDPNCHKLKSKECPPLRDSFPSRFNPMKTKKPSWLEHCGRVLRFYGFYQEAIPESANENYRIHQCEIRYFLDDGSIEVNETKTFDPGFLQGLVIHRHRIPLPIPPSSRDYYYTVEDLIVGCKVNFYGKYFFITGVDDLTRKYLNRMGKAVKLNREIPTDPYTEWREDRVTSLFARPAHINLDQDKFKKFLINGGKVLRFWSYWDNRCHEGELRKFLVHYFLEDDTIEIKEIVDPEGRIRGATTFLGRGKLLKNFKDLVPLPGIKEEAILILNTGGHDSCFMETSFLADRLCPGVDNKEFVTDKDLAIGAVLNVYGRAFILTECDKATQTYYREKYCVQDFTPLVLQASEEPRPYPKMEIPPHIGIGDELDTLINWDKLEPKQPKRAECTVLCVYEDKDVLGFNARLDDCLHKVNADRRFIIKIFMTDNTVQIFEKPHRNTGLKQGTFLSRSKFRKSASGVTPRYELGENSEYYKPHEYYVGNVLSINGFQFLLTSADEFSLSFMERHSHIFPQSNLCKVMDKVKEAAGCHSGEDLLHAFSERDTCLNGVMDSKDFKSLVCQIVKCGLNEHELITLKRGFRVPHPNFCPNMGALQSVVQTELRKFNFDKHLLSRVEYTMRYHDPCRSGFVDKETVRATLKGARLPVHREIIDLLVDNFETDHCGRINYCCLMLFLDWACNPVQIATPSHYSCVKTWLHPKGPSEVNCVNYHAFLNEICPNLICAKAEFCCQPCCPKDPCGCQGPCQCPDPCCPKPCNPEDILLRPFCCYDDPCGPAIQRELATTVITDYKVTPEDVRCCKEDYESCQNECCRVDSCPDGPSKYWTSDDFCPVDPKLLQAYQPNYNQCDVEVGNKEFYHPGDQIGFEHLYKVK